MKRIGTATIAAFLGVVIVVGAIVAIVGFGTDGATALRVGDVTRSRESLNDELRSYSENAQLESVLGVDNLSRSSSSVTAPVSTFVSTWWIRGQLANRVLDDRDEDVTAADRTSAQQFLDESLQGAVQGLPSAVRRDLVNQVAALIAVQRVEPDRYERLMSREASDAGVEVDPVYGLWHQRVVSVGRFPAPAGPATPTAV